MIRIHDVAARETTKSEDINTVTFENRQLLAVVSRFYHTTIPSTSNRRQNVTYGTVEAGDLLRE